MEGNETVEGLDDLRKKRLAYFETINQTDTPTGHREFENVYKEDILAKKFSYDQNIVTDVLSERHDFNRNSYQNYNDAHGLDNNILTKQSPQHHGETSSLKTKAMSSESSKDIVVKKPEKVKPEKSSQFHDGHNLTTTSFYLSNPDMKKEDHVSQQPLKPSVHTSLKHFSKEQSQKSDGLDAYNETVERLIRATKEEMLGIQPSDDIWTKIKNEPLNDTANSENNNVDNKIEHVLENGLNRDQDSKQCEKQPCSNSEIKRHQFGRSISESGPIERPSTQSASSIEHNVDYRSNQFQKHRSSFSGAPQFTPEPSKFEPSVHHMHAVHTDHGPAKKSLNSNQVEEIFSSRQIPRQTINSANLIQESQEFEHLKQDPIVHQSQELSELGLSTHRPDSERKDEIMVEAENLNLGDTITKELRTVLGEEKFQEFLMKSRRDIDDFHERSSQSSERRDKTPRLLKDKPTKPDKNVSKPISVKDEKTPRQKRERKDSREGFNKQSAENLTSPSKSSQSFRNSQDFTPRLSDADAVENMIGEFVTKKPEVNSSKKFYVGSEYKPKSQENDSSKTVDNSKDTSVVVPSLNLGETEKKESPRPKLNRPKHEPPTIYPDKQEERREKQERTGSGDSRLRQSNYEQVTVPRNVAFSADEIYNQAYGAMYPGQSVLMGSHHPQGGFSNTGQYGGMPQTPTTPVGPPHVTQSFTQGQQFAGGPRAVNYDMSTGYPPYKGLAVRQSSYTNDPRPPPPDYYSHVPSNMAYSQVPANMAYSQVPSNVAYSQVPSNMAYSQVYSSADLQGFTNTSTRYPGSSQGFEEQVHVPHPPSTPSAVSKGAVFVQPSLSASYSSSHTGPVVSSYHQQAMPVAPHPPVGSMNTMPETLENGIPMKTHIPTVNDKSTHIPVSMAMHVPHVKPLHIPVSMSTQTTDDLRRQSPPPLTPTTSHAEVQTDRENSPDAHDNCDKVTMVEESTFTSVSQIVDEEKFMPHPPAVGKDGNPRPSPRRHHKTDIAARKTQDSKRHIDGIRQHHEQRRQQQDDEKLSEDQIVDRQKRFAKASLERYFSSLENVYTASSTQPQPGSLITDHTLQEESPQAGDLELESLTSERYETGSDVMKKHFDVMEAPVDVIDDVTSTVLTMNDTETYQDLNTKTTGEDIENNFNPVAVGFIDFSEQRDFDSVTKVPTKFQSIPEVTNDQADDTDGQTLVNSEANTEMTLKAGGLTARLNDLGLDVSHRKPADSTTDKQSDKKSEKKGKVLIICPDCKALNKEYMSWCTQCGEMIIGVEPMLVSKNKEGKIRTIPLDKGELSSKHTEIRIEDPAMKSTELRSDLIPNSEMVVNYEQETNEKPFTLNLDAIKTTDNNEYEVHVSKKGSPIKSDGKDSGRPSSDDPDLELQTQKIEEEVVNDICASISDPVVKGYVKSHFSKTKQSHHDSYGISSFEPEQRNKNVEQELLRDLGLDNFDMAKTDGERKDQQFVVENVSGHVDNVKHYKEDNYKGKYDDTQFEDDTHDNVQAKIAMYNQKNLEIQKMKTRSRSVSPEKYQTFKNKVTDLEDEPLLPPPIPSFSETLPVSRNELSLKLPANSLDYSTDVSQVISHNFEATEHNHSKVGSSVQQGDNAELEGRAEDPKVLSKEERRRERRKKRGHGAIDVEVFGYEESRESRNSSRANRMVPLLNLAGNSSDDDDSIHSDFKPVLKQEVKKPVSQLVNAPKVSMNAWEPAVIPEEPDDHSPVQQFPVAKEPGRLPRSSPWQQAEGKQVSIQKPQTREAKKDISEANSLLKSSPPPAVPSLPVYQDTRNSIRSPEVASPVLMDQQSGQGAVYRAEVGQDQSKDMTSAERTGDWEQLFDPLSMEQEEVVIDDNEEEEGEDTNQPFLLRLVNQSNQPKPTKSKQRPKSAQSAGKVGKPVKSKVRQSMEESGYQRKWARSSTAWGSYNAGELNTSSSLRSSGDFARMRPASAPKSRISSSIEMQASGSIDEQTSPNPDGARGFSPTRGLSGKKGRPFSADISKRKPQKKKPKKGNLGDSFDLELDLEMIEHRLPKPSMLDRLQAKPEVQTESTDNMASPRSTYDKYIEMTPRIEDGTVSRWQCLPDEILLHIFAYLDQTSVTKVAQVCRHFYRVAMDESLWKYITIKKGDIDDMCLEEIAQRHPVSLALIHCYGDNVSAKGLRDLFKECSPTLKELNVAKCSRGALQGDSLLLHAAARCHNITHLDASWCHVTDSGLMAISNCCHRLESLCISGCSAVTNDGLETVIKRHGATLRVLEMFGCFNLSPRGLRSVANNCVNLLTLNLGQCSKITDSCISQLSTSLGRVETLDLRGCKQAKDNCIRRVVKNCTRLKHLSLANCPNITDVSILEISTYLNDIRSLDVCGCKNITDGSVRALVNTCTNLRHIDISSTGCTHRSVSMIANFSGQRLESLKINFLSDVTEQSLIKLARHCQRLKSVHMYGCTSVRNIDKVRDERPSFTIEM